jgi:hypothetical protein
MSEASNRMARLLTIAEMGALRSECARWMAENHDAFAAMLKTYRPRWELLAVTLVQDKLLPEPTGYWSDDPAIRGPARKQAGRAAKRVWDRVHARLKARVGASGAAAPAPLPDTAGGAASRLLAEGPSQRQQPAPPMADSGPTPAVAPEYVPEPPKFHGPAIMRSRLPKPSTGE